MAFKRNQKSDEQQDGRENGTLLTEIGYIKANTDDIKHNGHFLYLPSAKQFCKDKKEVTSHRKATPLPVQLQNFGEAEERNRGLLHSECRGEF